MSRKRKKAIVLAVDDLFQDRDHSMVDIKNLTLREFKAIACALRSYADRYGADDQSDILGINIINLSSIFDEASLDMDVILFKMARGEYHG